MKKIYFSLLFFFMFFSFNAQQWAWVRQATLTTGTQSSKKVCVDNAGNVFIIGNNIDTAYYGTVLLDSGSFAAEYSAAGSLLWVKKINGNAQNIATDAAGNLFLVGNFSGNLSIDTFNLISNGGTDIFLAKISSAGIILSLKSYGGPANDEGISIAIDKADAIYVTGIFRDSIAFDTTTLKILASNNYGNQLFYCVKFNSSGTAAWAKTCPDNFSGNSFQYHTPSFLCLDKNSNVYITGRYTFFPCGNYCDGGFILKYDSAGNMKLNKQPWNIFEWNFGLAVNDNADIFVVYNCGSHYTSCRTLDKYDSVMNLKWQKHLGDYTYGENYTFESGLSLDSTGAIYISGIFGKFQSYMSDSVQLCNQLIIGKGLTDILVGKFDQAGNCMWVKTAGGAYCENYTWYNPLPSMCVDKNGNCYLTSMFNGASSYNNTGIPGDAAFDNDTVKSDGNWQQIYLAKLNSGGQVMTLNEFTKSSGYAATVFPNPSSGIFTVSNSKNFSGIEITNILGEKIYSSEAHLQKTEIDLSDKPKGIYFVEILSGEKREMKKIIIE